MNSARTKLARRIAGFTLIETLVVLGIITVLVGISIPTLRVMREEARSTGCRTTLREIGLGLSAYRANINDRIPSCEPLPAVIGDETEGGLPEVLDGYLDKDCTCWICGADVDPESTVTGTSYLYVPGLLRYSPQIQLAVAQALIPYLENPDWNPDQLELIRRNIESRELMGVFVHHSGRRLPLLIDSQDRHPVGDLVPRNALFTDGSVAQMREAFTEMEDGG
jgi:prepilin-type N-terminal cleavage/methylation domain-containing protein